MPRRNLAAVRAIYRNVRIFGAILCFSVCGVCQDAHEIVRRAVELDQANWIRMADYTWVGREHERHFDQHQKVTSDHEEGWETVILDGQPFRRTTERDGKPLPAEELHKQQQKLDKDTARLEKQSPAEKQRRAAEYDQSRRRERAFLLEAPEAFDLTLEGSDQIDGRDVWVISGAPKPGYRAKTREAAAFSKIRAKIWVEKAGYQWVRLEAQTTGTISIGLFLARLNPGAKLVIEQTLVNGEVWLPKREYMSGTGRIALLKRVSEDDEITWNDYKKFQVTSTIVPR